MLFTDGSVDPNSKVGCGAYLILTRLDVSLEDIQSQVEIKRFNCTTSTKLELQTLLWALKELDKTKDRIEIYTDCQTILQLPQRRQSLETSDYRSKSRKLLSNHELYKQLYTEFDQLDYLIIKVKGHKVTREKNQIDHLFALVDKAARKALRGIQI